MIRFLKIFIVLSTVATCILLINFIENENTAVRSLPFIIEAKLHTTGENYVPLSQIPLSLQQAIIDTEDRSFYSNPGVSPEGIIRSLLIDLNSESFMEGGSTITQQLVKNQLLSDKKNIARKLKEIVLAVIITNVFSKQNILAMYLNSVYFGHGAWGINAAARTYFNKQAAELTLGQSALLAGLPQSPSYYDPFKNYRAARIRQEQVLQAMIQAGDLTPDRAIKIMKMPLNLHH